MRKNFRSILFLHFAILFLLPSIATADLLIGDSTLQDKKRVGRVLFEYTYIVEATNTGDKLEGVKATLTSTSPYTTIVDGDIDFGNIAAGATVSSSDTYIIRQDRTVPFDPTLLIFEFTSLPVANAGADQVDVPIGTTVTLDGSTSMAGYTGTLPLNFNWTLTEQPASSTATLSAPLAEQSNFVVDQAGIYKVELVVNDGVMDSALDTVVVSTLQQGGLSCGSLVPGSIDAAGEVDLFRFTGMAGEVVQLTLVETAGFARHDHIAPRGTLFASNGTQVGSVFDANSAPLFTLPAADTYVVRIFANDLVELGEYNIGLECISPVSATQGALVPGSLISDSMELAGETDLFTFSGESGDLIQLTLVETAGFARHDHIAPRGTLFASDGTQVGGVFDANSASLFTLPATDTYVVRIFANDLVELGEYNLGLEVITSL